METGKRDDLAQYLQTKLDEQKRDRENEALKKTKSPPKMAETVPTSTITEASASRSIATIVAKASVQGEKEKASAPKEKKNGEGKQKEQQPNVEEIDAIESDVESKAGLQIDEQLEATTEQNAGTGATVQSASANTSATPKGAMCEHL